MMTSSIRSSRNVRLIPSGRDECWSVGLVVASTMSSSADDTLKIARNSNIHPCIENELVSKFNRAPHSLRMDNKRVAYFNCELYTIPEDEAVCDSRTFEREESAPNEVVVDRTEAVMSKEFHAIVLQNERMIRVNPKKSIKGNNTKPVISKELHVPGDCANQRRQAWYRISEQLDGILPDYEVECWENEFNENTASDSNIFMMQ